MYWTPPAPASTLVSDGRRCAAQREGQMASEDLGAFQERVRGATLPGHEYLAEFDPDYFRAFRGFVGDFVYGRADSAIPERWRELILLGVLASANAWEPARLHIRRALRGGTTPR